MSDDPPEKPKSWFQPKADVKQDTDYNDSTKYGYTKADGWKETPKTPEEEAAEGKPETSANVQILKHDWVEDKEGYVDGGKKKGEGPLGKYSVEGGVGYYKVGAKSKLSVDLKKMEADLTLIKAEVKGSEVHAKAEGEFNLGEWFKGLFKKQPEKPPPSPGAPLAARVGDMTSHGGPLAPGIGSTNVIIGARPAWRTVVDTHVCAIPPHGGGVVVMGCPTVLINGMMATRVGDMVVEIPGGPDPIAMGCPTVLIGVLAVVSAAADAKGEHKDANKPSDDGLTVKGSVEGDELTAEASVDVGAKFSKKEVSATAKAGILGAIFKGSLEGSITIPLWGKHSITIGGSAEGTFLSAGAQGEASAGWKAEDGFKAKLGGKVGAGIGGVGLGVSLGFK